MPSLEQAAADYGHVSLADEHLVVVHLLLYGLDMEAPTLEGARAWAGHYGLDTQPNHVVLIADEGMLGEASFAMIPGLQLVGPDFVLRYDAAGRNAPHDLWTELWPAVSPMLQALESKTPAAR